MNPFEFMLLVLGATAFAAAAEFVARKRRAATLRALAAEWRMQYSPSDQLRLAERVAGRLPLPGAADVRVLDVMYAVAGDRRKYLFTAEFGRGVVTAKTRVRQVVALDEPVARSGAVEAGRLTIAPENASLLDQYRLLRQQQGGAGLSESLPSV